MRRLLSVCLILCVGCSELPSMKPKQPKPVTYKKVEVNLLRDKAGAITDKTVTITAPDDIRRILGFFPGFRTGKTSDVAATSLATVAIYFITPDDKKIQI